MSEDLGRKIFPEKSKCPYFKFSRDERKRNRCECHSENEDYGEIRKDWVRRKTYPKYCNHNERIREQSPFSNKRFECPIFSIPEVKLDQYIQQTLGED